MLNKFYVLLFENCLITRSFWSFSIGLGSLLNCLPLLNCGRIPRDPVLNGIELLLGAPCLLIPLIANVRESLVGGDRIQIRKPGGHLCEQVQIQHGRAIKLFGSFEAFHDSRPGHLGLIGTSTNHVVSDLEVECVALVSSCLISNPLCKFFHVTFFAEPLWKEEVRIYAAVIVIAGLECNSFLKERLRLIQFPSLRLRHIQHDHKPFRAFGW